MPVVKHISGIHTAPKKFLDYISKKDKTDGAKYATGINVPTDTDSALSCMKILFERFSQTPFYVTPAYSLNEIRKQKEQVRLHHYVQSFSPEENLSAEEAHQIGIKWANKVFGNNYQVLVTTHIDKGHIHNHFAVSAYSLDGKHWHDNQTTLNKCKRISDQIAREHGLSIITPKHKNTMKYYEWLAREKGISLKQKLQNKMDEFILSKDVKSIEDLADMLRQTGCEVRLGKFMTVKPPYSKRAYRTDNLDKTYGGYSIEELRYRIANKDKEISETAVNSYSGIQKTYAVYMRSVQITVYKKKSKEATYYDLIKNAELLNYLCTHNIHSVQQLQQAVDDTDERYRKKKALCDMLKKRLDYLLENMSEENKPIYNKVKIDLELAEVSLVSLCESRKRVSDIYKTYLNQTGDKPYIYERKKSDISEEYQTKDNKISSSYEL